jgi:pyrophosphatase PpaX
MSPAKLRVKGIMFDLDGTILDTMPAYIEAGKIAFKATGQETPETSLLLAIPKRLEQKQPISDIVKTDVKGFLDLYLKTFYTVAADRTKPMPHIAKTLETLSKKAKLAVITMRFMPKETIAAELKQYKLDKYFAHIVTALDTDKPKPSPEALIKAVAVMDVQMCDCVIVGDSVVDVKAGKAAGAKTVAVLSGLYSREELSKAEPDFIINNVAELLEILE